MKHASDHALRRDKLGDQSAIIVRPPMSRLSRERPEQTWSTTETTPQLRRTSHSSRDVAAPIVEPMAYAARQHAVDDVEMGT
jgi:hypothetical protein